MINSNISNISSLWKRRRVNENGTHLPRLLLNENQHPRYVRTCPVTKSVLPLLRLVDWAQLPLTLAPQRTGMQTIPLCAYVGAWLLKVERQVKTAGALYRFLGEHPALIWALGFPLVFNDKGEIDVTRSLPTQRHFNRKLSELPNEPLQNLLDSQVEWLQERLGKRLGSVVAIDTKHIIAWVKENNPKQFIKEGRFDKTRQPVGDPDCKLGCKRSRNQTTPTKEGKPAPKKVSVGEYYWGYASGVVAAPIPNVGEFVLAELTQTFDKGEPTYFFPLMTQVEERLGYRPPYGTADAGFDAFYVFDYFDNGGQGGFAAVPRRKMKETQLFDEAGLPLCEAALPMPLKSTFTKRGGLVQHKRGRYGCPLLHPEPNGETCPIAHVKWEKGGCEMTMPTAAGARIRYQLDRDADEYKTIYNQRTSVERIFSQAVALGIERPKLRNQQAITNLNTLMYILINLRAMRRLIESETSVTA